MVKFAFYRVTWGGQGHSPNGMANCVCNLPYGWFSGVLWGRGGQGCPVGHQGGPAGDQRGPREVLERFWMPLGKGHFLVVGGWTCQLSDEILMVSASCGSVRRSVVIRLFYSLAFLQAHVFAKQWGEDVMKNNVLFSKSKIASSDSNQKWCQQHDFRRCQLRPRSITFEYNPGRFSRVWLLRSVRFLKEQLTMMLVHESEKVNNTLDVEQHIRFW